MILIRSITIFLVLNLIAVVSLGAHAAKADMEVHEIIKKLSYKLLLASTDERVYSGEVSSVQNTLKAYIKDHVEGASLTFRDEKGRTPLILSAWFGYSEVVEILLENKSVVDAIDAKDNSGLTAWDYSNLALHQSYILCNPSAFKNDDAATPILLMQDYYVDRNGYLNTRNALEKAGSSTSVDRVKAGWNSLCIAQDYEVLQNVKKADDVLRTITKLNTAAIAKSGRKVSQKALARLRDSLKDRMNADQSGFRITNFRPRRLLDGGVDFLEVNGKVKNLDSENEYVPSLRLILLDADRNVLQSAVAKLDNETLKKGETTTFVARIANPDERMKRLEVKFQ